MKIKNYSDFRANLTQTIDEVIKDHTPVIITRTTKAPVVVLSLEDFQAYEETFYLTKNPHNYKRLIASIKNIKNKNYQTKALAEY